MQNVKEAEVEEKSSGSSIVSTISYNKNINNYN